MVINLEIKLARKQLNMVFASVVQVLFFNFFEK